jgi:succinyl-diaminopimelate desuccinylase
MGEIDPVALTQALVRCPSVTPAEAGALTLLEDILSKAGFACMRVDRGGVCNLYARFGDRGPVFGFNGHTDVVPVGDEKAWSVDPFAAARESNDWIIGRGTVDMKSGVAAFVAAAIAKASAGGFDGSIALAITGDEEGDARHGTLALLDWMAENGEQMDVCVVGEPTSEHVVGDQIKIGRRGSMTACLRAYGRQGHTAYPQLACNPLPPLIRLLDGLTRQPLDAGTAHFQASTLALTTVDVGNSARNIIPNEARAVLNIRYNNRHSSRHLEAWIKHRIARCIEAFDDPNLRIEGTFKTSGDAFLTAPGALTDLASQAISDVIGIEPKLDTGGGTSDARFIKNHCPVVEIGLVGKGMHQVDEKVFAPDITRLSALYRAMLDRFFP